MRPARILAVISALYLSIIAVYYVTQRDYVFRPNTLRIAPETLGLGGVVEMTLATPDGEQLVVWYGAPEKRQPTLFYLHGNAGALAHRVERVRLYRAQGYGVFFLAYRGFSGSTGSPTEARIVADALMAYDKLVSFTPPDSKIVIYGESLGTGVAVQVAAKRKPAGVILESPFSSVTDVGAHLYPFLPVYWLLKDRFDSIRYIRDVKAPLLVLHGEQDRLVPPFLGRKLFAAAPGPKQGLFIAEANHYSLYQHGAFDKIRDFLGRFAGLRDMTPDTITVSCRPNCPKVY